MGGVRRVGLLRLADMIKGLSSYKFYNVPIDQEESRAHLYRLPSKGVAAVETAVVGAESDDIADILQEWEEYGQNLINIVEVPRQGAVLESSLTVSAETGVQTYRHQLTLPTRSLGKAAAALLISLAHVEDLIAFVELWDGTTLLMGWDDGSVKLSGVESTTGGSWGDAPGHDITLACDSEYPLLPLAIVDNDAVIMEFNASIAETFFSCL